MKIAEPRIINGPASILLDSLRLCAALVVLYIHAFDRWFPSRSHPGNEPGEPSHAAVIVFFVLSGYVIAHTTISKNRGGMQYAQARLSRLYSVVMPALVITAVIQLLLSHINPVLLASYSRGHTGVRFLLSGLYLNELWLLSSAPPLNGSLWSLSFEFWYYTIFGIWVFRKPGWKGVALLVLAGLIAGPKIILMMPVWLMGYLAYRLPRPAISKSLAWALVFLSLLAGYFAVKFIPAIPYDIGYKPLYYANQFFTDWLVGIFIGAALWVLPNGSLNYRHTKAENWFRQIADLTFPLYVLHFPLLILWRGLFGFRLNDMTQLWEAIISVIITAAIIGIFLEKQRPLWTRFFKWLLNGIRAKLSKSQPKLNKA